MKKKIAIFDLDGTITKKDSFLEFIKFSRGHKRYYFGIIMLFPYILLFYFKRINNHDLKERFFSFFFKNCSYEKIKKDGDRFSSQILPNICRNSALNVLNWHITQKHDILILSASSSIWLGEWCVTNNFSLISTEFEVKNSLLTGKIFTENCYGEEKKKRLSNYLLDHNYVYSYGYGDSAGDKFFLELVDQPYLMKLNKKNISKNWEVNSQ